jgi:PAS domain S-box-containing protein
LNIDIRTTALFAVIINFIQVIFLALHYFLHKSYKGAGWWLMWGIFVAAGFAFLGSRTFNVFDEKYAVFFQNIFLAAGLISLYIGILSFFNRKVNKSLPIISFIIFLIINFVFSFIRDRADIRSILLNLYVFIWLLVISYSLNKHKLGSVKTVANFLAIILLAQSVFYALKVINVIKNPESGFFLSNDINTQLAYIFGVIASLFLSFGLIVMVNQKLNSDIRLAKEHFEMIFNASPDAVFITEIDTGKIIQVNNSFTDITGYSKEDAIGKTTNDIGLWRYTGGRNLMIEEIIERGSFNRGEFKFYKKDEKFIWASISIASINLYGKPHFISGVRDISHLKETERQLREKNLELEKVNTEKDKMFSIVSHDLRNALNGFLGFTDLLVKGSKNFNNEEIFSIATDMNSSAINLQKLMSNLLEWSIFKRGLIKVKSENIPLSVYLDEMIAQVIDAAHIKNITITKFVHPELFVFTDRTILSICLRNIISNAVKFTNRGGNVEIIADKYQNDKIRFCVQDNGIGMRQEIVDNLFDNSKQFYRKGTNNEQSAGLGLQLVKECLDKLNGTISVESSEGKGSKFTFILQSYKDDFENKN